MLYQLSYVRLAANDTTGPEAARCANGSSEGWAKGSLLTTI